jgi:hypothetical protein
VGYVSSKGTLPLYLDELNQHVLPADPKRLVYYPINDPSTPAASVEPLTVGGADDYSQLAMHVYPSDIYLVASCLLRARILGEAPASGPEHLAYYQRLRDIGLRSVVYHEMTHALERAYVNVHTPEQERKDKSAWLYASQTLINVDTQYHWQWGGHFADLNNRHVSAESQSEGIAFVVLVAHYNMSARQQAAVWDHSFGRLDDSRAALDASRDLFERDFPDYASADFGSQLGPVMGGYPTSEGRFALGNIAGRLSALPSIVGYLHPMLPQDTEKVWAALRQP